MFKGLIDWLSGFCWCDELRERLAAKSRMIDDMTHRILELEEEVSDLREFRESVRRVVAEEAN